MIYRRERDGLLLFEASTGQTAFLSGEELRVLENWLETGRDSAFVRRLHDLRALRPLRPEQKRDMLEQIRSEHTSSPFHCMTVPESIHIDLTTRCPYHCPQCYKGEQDGQDLPFTTLDNLIRQAQEMRVFQIAFGGGEPLLYPGLEEAVRQVSQAEMACTITTSGGTLSAGLLERLTAAGLRHMQVSLNGSREEIHRRSRDGFREAIAALKLLRGSGLSYGVNWVARKDNLADFEDMAELVKTLGAGNLNILRYKPSPAEEYAAQALSRDEHQLLADKIRRVRGLTVKLDSAYSFLLCGLYGEEIPEGFSGCGAGRRFFAVSADGRFHGCSHCEESEPGGDIRRFWRQSPLLERFRRTEETVEGDCAVCSYRDACRGCRAICMRQYGNFHAGEQNCPAFERRVNDVCDMERL